MRVVAAMFKHETNTFSPVPTPLARFGDGGPYWGDAALAQYRGTNTPLGAFIDLAEARGAELSVPVAGEAWPSGRVADDAYATVTDAILAAVDAGCDVLLLDLHGAMATESLDDGEGALVARIREAHPDLPIAVALDLHANVTDALVRNATAIAGFKTYPHVDMYATGERVGRIVLDAAEGKATPRMAWGNRPMIPHIMRQGTDEAPMRDLIASAEALEADGALAASVFGGFPHADIRDAGLSCIVVTEGRMDRAERGCAELLDQAWAAREAFVYRSEPLATAVARAKALADGPVLLLDHSDNCGSGGTQDVMTVIAEVLRQELDDVVVFAVHDPEAVAAMAEAGVGAEVTLALGGKYAMPAIGLEGRPLEVTGRVRLLGDGGYTIQGPMYTGVRVSMGRAAVLDTGRARLVVIERHHEPWDVGCLTSLGLDPTRTRYVLLKSRVHWRAGFWPLVRHVVDLAGDGVTTSDYGRLGFERLRRPIYPLDTDIDVAPDV
jgi:microcystin degradation protein MlrC